MRLRDRILTAVTALLFISAGAGMAAARAEAEQHKLGDHNVTQAIETELLLDEGVPSHKVNITTLNGVVTLSGTVSNLLAKDRAEKLARTIKGVRSVVNEIDVTPVFRSDSMIKRDINEALVTNPATESYEIDVDVDDGNVTLRGSVESWAEEQLSVQVAKGVKGVKSVDNQIELAFARDRTDPDIAQDIRERLEANVWIDDALIDVEVNDGKVALNGAVGSAAERSRARFDAWVSGVRAVDVSDLDVKWWARDEMRREQRYSSVSDREIETAVEDAFVYDPRVASHNINVTSDNGVVTLSGTVDNLQAKQAAEQDAENTIGVWRVKNLVRVRTTETFVDEEIEDDILQAFERDPYLDRVNLDVTVLNGKAYLTGTVYSSFARNRAELVASGVPGVVEVDNNLEVATIKPLISDWEIEQDIESELFWSPFVDEDEVTVVVDNGVATLTGTVDTWDEYRSAAENALEGGALAVDNNLRVRFGPES